MEQRLKRLTALLLTALLLLGAAGCGSGGASGEESIRLMDWPASEDQSKDSGEWLQTCCENFAALHPEWDITFVYGVADEATAAGSTDLLVTWLYKLTIDKQYYNIGAVVGMLSRMMLSGANVLMLDQPTNHLDLESIAALNKGLEAVKCNVLVASHDHQLIQTVCNRVFDFTADGRLIDSKTTYGEYLERLHEAAQ